MKSFTLIVLLLVCGVSAMSFHVPLAVGAAAGYIVHDRGYRVQNPITKEE